MLSDNKQITLMAQGKVDYTVEAFAVDFAEQGIMMAIPTPEACIYVVDLLAPSSTHQLLLCQSLIDTSYIQTLRY